MFVGADPEVDPPLEHGSRIGEPAAEPHVAARIVRDRGAMVAEAGHVVFVEPHAVGHREVRAEYAEAVEVRGLRPAVEPDPGYRLDLGFGDVAMDSEAKFTGQRGAAEDEAVGTVMRYRRRYRGTHPVAVEGPAAQCLAHRFQGCVGRREPQLGDAVLERPRQRLDQAGDRLVKAAIGDHRRDDRAHSDIGVGLPRQCQPFGGRQWPLEGQVIAGGAALHDHLDRAELGGKIFVLGGAVSGDPRRCAQQQFERPAVAHSFREVAVAVRVGVDETRMQQPASRRDLDRIGRGRAAGRPDLANRIVLDQDIGGFRSSCGDVEHAAAAQDRRGHGIVSHKAPRMIFRSARGAERCLVLSCSGARPFSRSS
jgi:hypothetical protein